MTTDKPAEETKACCPPRAGKSECCGPARAIEWVFPSVLLAVSYCALAMWSTKVLPTFNAYLASRGASYNEISTFLIGCSSWAAVKIPLLFPLIGVALAILVAKKCCSRCGAGLLQLCGLLFALLALTTLFFTGVDLATSLIWK